jgi:hypothetical protein
MTRCTANIIGKIILFPEHSTQRLNFSLQKNETNMSKKSKPNNSVDKKFPLPIYKKEDDIYNKEKEEPLEEEQPEKRLVNKADKSPGDDLDIPGTELDDVDEEIGEEDEENNYYSLGGDDHDDLEEDKA